MSRPFSLLRICEDAYALNVLTRERRLHRVNRRGFYTCKHALIRYLYEHGYCKEVLLQKQDHVCWNCDGEGCFRCNNGIYKVTFLYAFMFEVESRRFKWHVPNDLLSFVVKLTDPAPSEFALPALKQIEISERHELWMMTRLVCGLWLRGAAPRFDGPGEIRKLIHYLLRTRNVGWRDRPF